jgi:hypothetical protein
MKAYRYIEEWNSELRSIIKIMRFRQRLPITAFSFVISKVSVELDTDTAFVLCSHETIIVTEKREVTKIAVLPRGRNFRPKTQNGAKNVWTGFRTEFLADLSKKDRKGAKFCVWIG